jgi:hypothetical protein
MTHAHTHQDFVNFRVFLPSLGGFGRLSSILFFWTVFSFGKERLDSEIRVLCFFAWLRLDELLGVGLAAV